MRRPLIRVIGRIAILLSICSSCQEDPQREPVVPVTDVALNETSVEMNIGETIQLMATIKPSDASDKTVVWTSSAPAVATVGAEGLVSAIATGDATVTASVGAKSASCTITVSPEKEEDNGYLEERDFLIALYNATGGAVWKNKDNWCSEESLDKWFGVELDEEGHVISLDLSDNNLSGCIPESIDNLTHLSYLAFKNNHILQFPGSLRKMDVWKEYWGDILFGNDLYLSDFIAMEVPLPDRLQEKKKEGGYTYFLQWTPTADDPDRFLKDSLVVDSFKKWWYEENIDVVAWCINATEEEARVASEQRELPWDNPLEINPYPIHDFCPAWVLVNPEGIIINTNLFPNLSHQTPPTPDTPPTPEDPETPPTQEVGGAPAEHDVPIPGYEPIQITVSYPRQMTFPPTITMVDLSNEVSFTTNKNRQMVHIYSRSITGWIAMSDSYMIVNGNPSLKQRFGTCYLDVYYGSLRVETLQVNITQNGVYLEITDQSNIAEFDLLQNVSSNLFVKAFTPYAETQSISLLHNSDGFLNVLSPEAQPNAIINDGYDASNPYPEVSYDSRKTDIDGYFEGTFHFSYDCNPSLLARGCVLHFVPIIYVIDDWNDVQGSVNWYYVDDGNGMIANLGAALVQTQPVIYAEYDTYISEAIAPEGAQVAGYNRLKAYSDITNLRIATDVIKVYSTVSWSLRDLSFENENWQYVIRNAEYENYEEDGKHLRAHEMNIYVNDYLKSKVGGKYRPAEIYPTRWTKLRVNVNLRSRNFVAELADIGQVGIPATAIIHTAESSCKEGDYYYEGNKYIFRNPVSIDFETYSDDLIDKFSRSPYFYIMSSASAYAGVSFGWISIPKWSTNYSAIIYSNVTSNHHMTYDWRVQLTNGVWIYALQAVEQTVTITVTTKAAKRREPSVTQIASDIRYTGSRLKERPKLTCPIESFMTKTADGHACAGAMVHKDRVGQEPHPERVLKDNCPQNAIRQGMIL